MKYRSPATKPYTKVSGIVLLSSEKLFCLELSLTHWENVNEDQP